MPARLIHESKARTRLSGSPVCPHDPPPSGSPTRDKLLVRKSQPVQNRVGILMVHIPKLSIRGQARIAAMCGVSRSTISRLVGGRINPSYRLARSVTTALERLLGEPLDMRDVFSTDGTYLEPSGCVRCGCSGCLPESAWDQDGTLKTEWRDARPGDWSLARPAGSAEPCPDPARHADKLTDKGFTDERLTDEGLKNEVKRNEVKKTR